MFYSVFSLSFDCYSYLRGIYIYIYIYYYIYNFFFFFLDSTPRNTLSVQRWNLEHLCSISIQSKVNTQCCPFSSAFFSVSHTADCNTRFPRMVSFSTFRAFRRMASTRLFGWYQNVGLSVMPFLAQSIRTHSQLKIGAVEGHSWIISFGIRYSDCVTSFILFYRHPF